MRGAGCGGGRLASQTLRRKGPQGKTTPSQGRSSVGLQTSWADLESPVGIGAVLQPAISGGLSDPPPGMGIAGSLQWMAAPYQAFPQATSSRAPEARTPRDSAVGSLLFSIRS